jgi:hypothetical protein
MRARFVATSATVAALLLGGVMALPATAEPPVLTVSGTGPAMIDVTLTSAVTFDYGDAVIVGTGRYAGFAVWRITGAKPEPLGGVLASRDLDGPARPAPVGATTFHTLLAPMLLGRNTVTLAAGIRYRVFLLADDRAEIRIPLAPGASGLTIQPAKKSRQTYEAQQAAVSSAATTAALRVPLTVRGATRYEILARLGSGPGFTEDVKVTACVTRRGAKCTRGAFAQETSNGGMSPWATTSGLGVRGALLDRTIRDARAEAKVTGAVNGSLALVVVAYDLG